MAGMLTVVNPRRRRRRSKVRSHRRRRRSSHARASNPIRRRRRRSPVARRHVRRHRRRHNPAFRLPGLGGSGAVGTVVKGFVGAGVGAVGARILTNVANKQFFGGNVSGATKIGLELGVGVVGFIVANAMRQRALAVGLATGAGVVAALDLYDMVKPNLPAFLQDYQYGSLNDYQYGSLDGWAPQGSNGLSGGNVYEEGVYGS